MQWIVEGGWVAASCGSGFYSPDLEGFTGVGNSIEDCLYKATWGMEDHLALPPLYSGQAWE